MRCRVARRLSSDYLAGDLDDRQRSALRGHLRECEECRALYDDEAELIRAADAIEPVDPPPSLWEGISARLAEEEVRDASRSSAWFWWRGVWHRHRAHFVGSGLAIATVLALLVWPALTQRDAGKSVRLAAFADRASSVANADLGGSNPAANEDIEFTLAVGQEIARADARYRGTVDELQAELAAAGATWTPAQQKRHAERMREFELAVASHRQDGLATEHPAVFERDQLYNVYRDHIDYLTEAAFEAEGW